MKRFRGFGVSLFISILIFSFSVSAIRINEVELNPEGTDTGNEWIELYSQENVNLSFFRIKNNDNKTINLTGNFLGFLIVNFSTQWLDNSQERVFLIFNESIFDETPALSDSSNDNRTWQYCNNWTFNFSTKGTENLCPTNTQNETPDNQTQQQNDTNNQQNQSQAEIYLQLNYDDEVENEFEVEVKAYNLRESYDVKIYLTDEDDKIISETYNDEERKWGSSNYYINSIFNETGNKTETFKLRLDGDYKNFSGDARINAKIRKSGTSTVLAEIGDNIEILRADEGNSDSEKNETEKTVNKSIILNAGNQDDAIELNPKGIKSQNSETLTYKSKTQYIKEYAIYAFALFCVLIIVLLIMRRL